MDLFKNGAYAERLFFSLWQCGYILTTGRYNKSDKSFKRG